MGYLLHSFVMTKAFEAVPYLPHGIRVVVAVAAAIGASLASYEFIEEPARRLLRPKRDSLRRRFCFGIAAGKPGGAKGGKNQCCDSGH